MRIAALLSVLVLVAATAFAAELTFVRVWPGWREAESFHRISEYFTNRENTGGQIVLRSQPDRREGFYFLARIKNTGGAVTGARIELHVITPDSPDVRTFNFTSDIPPHGQVFNVGITGTDWTEKENNPVAWKIVFIAPDGRTLGSEQSFLWGNTAR